MESKVNHGDGSATLRAKATTQNILGLDTPRPKIQPKWARHCENLTRLRDEILAKKETLAQDANVNGESGLLGEHLADAATDSYDRDWALSMLSSEQNALYEIDAALDRITRGTYGICELTGRPIEPGRLQALPWARFCAAAQRELEAKGAVGRTQLAEVGAYYGGDESVGALEDEDKELA
jgi:RNA polymerase-binding transcription factor DksA